MTIEYKDSKRIVGLSTDSTFDVDATPNTSGVGSDGTTWSRNDTGTVTFSNSRLNVGSDADSSVDGCSYDLGSGYIGDTWTLDYDFRFSTMNAGLGSYHAFMISNTGSSANWTSTNINAIWAKAGAHPSVSSADNMWIGESENSALDSGQDGQVWASGNGGWSTNTTFYARLTRVSDTQYKFGLYSDAGRTALLSGTQLVTGTITASAITDLRYISFNNYDGNTGGAVVGYFENIKFYNNTSVVYGEVKSKPTDVQDNSLFVEKDTGKRYWRTPEASGSDTNTTQTTYNDVSGIGNFDGGWGLRINAGHALVGQEIRSIKVRMRATGTVNTTNMTARLYGSTKTTLRATSTAISSAGLPSSFTDKTFVFPSGSRGVVQAGDHLLIVADALVASGSWNCQIKSSAGTNTHFTTWQQQTNAFTEQTSRELWYDPIVSGTFTPATWTMKSTYETDFSSSTGWTFKDSAKASISGGSLSFDFEDNSGNDDSCYYDLGSTMSDTKWLLRFKINWSTFDDNSRCWFGLADNTTAQSVAKDFIGLLTHKYSGTSNWESMDKSNASLDFAGENSSSTTISTGTDYWVQIRRLTDTTYDIKVYDDSAYTSLVDTVLGTMSASSISGLRYIMFYNRNDHETTYNQVGTIDDLSFYNGVTSIN